MPDRNAVTSVPLHHLLAQRHSTRAFDPEYRVGEEEITAMLEAARWAPSAGNSQPSRFIVARKDTPEFDRVLATLTDWNVGWAKNASLLVVGVRTLENDKGPLGHSDYDLGQAMAHLTVQALSDRLTVRQLAGFDADKLAAEFGLDARLKPRVVAAIGRADDPAKLPEDLRGPDSTPRARLPLTQIVL
ncbi:nitroreductase [Actinorhabdospora filicis]|uniref:Nitroreductase n=1 Tax=Actinorhabdospora filicis TaxID=1785913 RepID=A0A9W6SQI1_9ACTN|nr:nitroreductase family protein [Actinorhabdospora filicis]GLZ80307.1 nitroreductase [Actinorhabdospora filicis]